MMLKFSQSLMKGVALWVMSLMLVLPVAAQNNTPHDMDNLHATIQATDYKSSHFIETENAGGKSYIYGKSSSYKKNGEANANTLLQPYAEYEIKSKMPGGSYHILVYYAIDKDKAPATPKLSIAMNTQKPQELELKSKQLNKYVKATFKVKFLKGKKHTVKIWFPSEGVKVKEIKVLRALTNGKKRA